MSNVNDAKKLNLSKYAFLDWLKGDIYAWLNCNENFQKASKEDEMLRNSTPWRYDEEEKDENEENYLNPERFGFDNIEESFRDELLNDLPDPIKAGLRVGEYSELWAKGKFPNHRVIKIKDFSNENISKQTAKILQESFEKNEDLIIFEATFQYNEFTTRTDILVKTNNEIEIIEVKATSSPKKVHLFDLMFQKMIIDRQEYDYKVNKYSMLLLDKEYKHEQSYSKQEVANKVFINIDYGYTGKSISDKTISDSTGNKSKVKWNKSNNKHWENNLIDWDGLEETPIFEEKLVWKTYKGLVIERPDNRTKHFTFKISQLWETKLFNDISNNFDNILSEIKDIQLLDEAPILEFELRNRDYMSTDYETWALIKSGAYDDKDKTSIFDIRGNIVNWEKKCKFFLEGKKYIEDLEYQDLFSEKINVNGKSDHEILNDWVNKLTAEGKASSYNAFVQAYFRNNDEHIMHRELIDNVLSDYKQAPIYMYDFETANLAIPETQGASPYEQVVYQFSIHVITNPDDYDFETMKNVVHYEWLAEDRNTLYKDAWKEFVKPFQIHGPGKYVAWNMSFERGCIERRQKIGLIAEEWELLSAIREETIDLMVPFRDKYYYHKDLKGSYSIKYAGPHFASEINYKELPLVQRGDQSAAVAKNWLRENSAKSDEEWLSRREGMLKYCEYDTLLMVAILQRLQEKVKDYD